VAAQFDQRAACSGLSSVVIGLAVACGAVVAPICASSVRLALAGAQRLTSLGYAADPNVALPQDAIEPVRRMVKWIVDETCDPTEVPPMWEMNK
jgi:hypothetical protein